MKKLFSLLLVCALAFTMSVSAFAAEATPPTEKEPSAQTEMDATTRAAEIPTESADLPYEATVVNLCEVLLPYIHRADYHRGNFDEQR